MADNENLTMLSPLKAGIVAIQTEQLTFTFRTLMRHNQTVQYCVIRSNPVYTWVYANDLNQFLPCLFYAQTLAIQKHQTPVLMDLQHRKSVWPLAKAFNERLADQLHDGQSGHWQYQDTIDQYQNQTTHQMERIQYPLIRLRRQLTINGQGQMQTALVYNHPLRIFTSCRDLHGCDQILDQIDGCFDI